jgi:spermidine/putrescine transport system permease protein
VGVSQRLKSKLTPYLLILPGGLWLVVFFAAPVIMMIGLSTETGNIISGFTQTFHFQNYLDGFSQFQQQWYRSALYAGLGCLISIVLSYPIAYWIAFYGGNRKSTYLFLILLPFFVSFVLRTIAWNYFLSDNGLVLGPLKSLHLLPQNYHILATSSAVIGGIVYNYLPFMILPIYVALERVDPRVVEAARDLYAGSATAFRKVVLPLSLPGVFAGVLLNFVPAASDYVNASVLGGTNDTMIGNVIQDQYFNTQNYPLQASLSFSLMAVLLVGIFIYARVLGTESVLEAAAR